MRSLRTALVVCALAGCTSKQTTTIEATAYLTGWPASNAPMVFADIDGEARTLYTDRDGHATGEVEIGGSVTLGLLDNNGSALFTSYANIQPGMRVAFGSPTIEAAYRATMTVAGALPPGADVLAVRAPCMWNIGGSTIQLSTQCSTTVDLVVTAIRGFDVIAYIYLPGQPIIDGGTIQLDANAWHPVDDFAIDVRNASGLTLSGGVWSSLGVGAQLSATPTGLAGKLPLLGDLQLFIGAVEVDGGERAYSLYMPVRTAPLDLDALLPPRVTVSEGSWSIDDHAGTRVAQAMITSFGWYQPNPDRVEAGGYVVISPMGEPGQIVPQELPSPFAAYQPAPDVSTSVRVELFRADDLDPLEIPAAAELFVDGPIRNHPSVPVAIAR